MKSIVNWAENAIEPVGCSLSAGCTATVSSGRSVTCRRTIGSCSDTGSRDTNPGVNLASKNNARLYAKPYIHLVEWTVLVTAAVSSRLPPTCESAIRTRVWLVYPGTAANRFVVKSQLACVTSTTRKYLSNADVTAAAAAAVATAFAIAALLCAQAWVWLCDWLAE